RSSNVPGEEKLIARADAGAAVFSADGDRVAGIAQTNAETESRRHVAKCARAIDSQAAVELSIARRGKGVLIVAAAVGEVHRVAGANGECRVPAVHGQISGGEIARRFIRWAE